MVRLLKNKFKLGILCASMVFLAGAAFADHLSRNQEQKSKRGVHLSSLMFPLGPVQLIGTADIRQRDLRALGSSRSVIGFSVPLQLPEFGITDESSAKSAKFYLDILKDDTVVNTCSFDLVKVPSALRKFVKFGGFFSILVGSRYYYELELQGDSPVSGGCQSSLSNLAPGDKLMLRGENLQSEQVDLAIGELAAVGRNGGTRNRRR